MAIFEIDQLSFQFEGTPNKTLKNISFSIAAGDFVVVCGPSGCGKTTLLRHMKKELQPIGHMQGDIRFQRKSLFTYGTGELAGRIGMVMQDPENQLVTDHVQAELAFGMENLGVPVHTIRQRMAEMCSFFGMENWLHRPLDELSGGQKQIVNLASILMLQPEVILLDEPTAQLDPVAAREFMTMVHRLNQEFGMTIVITEHRLEEVFPLADQVVMLKNGTVQYSGGPRHVIMDVWKDGETGDELYLPAVSRLYLELGQRTGDPLQAEKLPLTVKEGREWFDRFQMEASSPIVTSRSESFPSLKASSASFPAKSKGRPLLLCHELFFRYEKNQPLVLRHCSLEIEKQDFLAIAGGNGAGKSTLLQLMLGLRTPQHGYVKLEGQKVEKLPEKERFRRIGYLAQNPMLYFAHDTVEKELLYAAEQQGYKDAKEKAEEMLRFFNLHTQRHTHPHDCSSGERQKTALACVLMSKPQLLLLDEPTKGLDPVIKQQLGEYLRSLCQQGMTIAMVTHDVEFSGAFASRCMLLFDGAITASGTPKEFFNGHMFYTTSINRVTRSSSVQALSVEDVYKAWRKNENS